MGQGGQVPVGQRVPSPRGDTEDPRGGVRRLEMAAGTLVSIETAELLAPVLSEFFLFLNKFCGATKFAEI